MLIKIYVTHFCFLNFIRFNTLFSTKYIVRWNIF